MELTDKYIFYRIDEKIGKTLPAKLVINGEEFGVRRVVPMFFNAGSKALLHTVAWHLLSLFRFREYQLIDSRGKIASYAQTMPKIIIFDFMKSGGVHLGPCLTTEKHRGKGLYPALLRLICEVEKNDTFYIFTTNENIVSQKGILKSGFKPIAQGYKSKIGVYKISKYL